MKRLLSAALALSLLSGTAAYAEPFDHRGGHHEYGDYDRGRDHGDHWRHHRGGDDTGAAVAVGVGIFALLAIIASQDRDAQADRDRAYDRDSRDYYYGDDTRPSRADVPDNVPPPSSDEDDQTE